MKKTFYTLFILLTFLLSLPASAQQEKVNTIDKIWYIVNREYAV